MDRKFSIDIDNKLDIEAAEYFRSKRRKETIWIGNHTIREYGDIFVIAEAGVNHNGRLDLALKMVEEAANAGADAIKFQTFKAEQVVTEKGEMANYQRKNLGFEKSQREMLKNLELRQEFYPPIIKKCQEKNIIFLSTPHGGKESVDFLESFKIQAYKVASGDLTNYILLNKLARLKKPIILSSGMADLSEIENAVDFIYAKGSRKVVVLHCTSSYPSREEDINLLSVRTMMEQLDTPIGYSDHTSDCRIALMAATMGICVYECHLTLDKNLSGPDHVASSTPQELKEKIEAIKLVKRVMGTGVKKPTRVELQSMIKLVRKSIVAAYDLKKNASITKEDLEAKRPGDGMSPVNFETLIGKKLLRNIAKDEQILPSDIYE